MGKTEKVAKVGDVRLNPEAQEAFNAAMKSRDIPFAVSMIARFLAEPLYEEYKVVGYSRAMGIPRWVPLRRSRWNGRDFEMRSKGADLSWAPNGAPLERALKARLKLGELMVINIGSGSYVFEHVDDSRQERTYFRLRKAV